MARLHSRLTDVPLSTAAAHAFCADRAAGATVVFTGTVRDHAEGRAVAGLDYEAYEEHAAAQIAALAAQVGAEVDACAVWMEHRVGTLSIGEHAVVVGVSAGHRQAAFAGARDGIDRLKATVAIWKREHWAEPEGAGRAAHWPGTD